MGHILPKSSYNVTVFQDKSSTIDTTKPFWKPEVDSGVSLWIQCNATHFGNPNEKTGGREGVETKAIPSPVSRVPQGCR